MSSVTTADIAIIGAAGITGQTIIPLLLKKGLSVRALLWRDSERARFPDLEQIETVELLDPATIAAALRGVRAVYYIPPVFNHLEELYGKNVIAACAAAGVSRLVFHSVMHPSTPSLPHHFRKAGVELAIRESPLRWTILQPSMYTRTPLIFLNAKRNQLEPGFSCESSFTPLDLGDLSEAVATVATEAGHEFATYELAGQDCLSYAQMADLISDVTGQRVSAKSIDAGQVVDRLVAAGGFLPDSAADLRAMLDHYDAHGLVGNSNVLRMLLRREPTSFATSLQSQRHML